MYIAFIRCPDREWGGDLKTVQDLELGLSRLGHKVVITTDVNRALHAESICFLGTTLADHRPEMLLMQILDREYGCIPFHEDEILFAGASFGFFYYVAGILNKNTEKKHEFSLDHLIERPHLIYYFGKVRTFDALINYEFLKNARYVISGSRTEERTILRDVPGCNTRVVRWAPGFVQGLIQMPDDEFLKFASLSKGGYILQVGRLSFRKNQIATLLATKDLDCPVVIIATGKNNPVYSQVFLSAAAQKRKAPVIIIAQNPEFSSFGNIKCLQPPGGRLLSENMLLGAFAHAGLHLHPAFYELPGYTYLESARFGTPTIASAWGALKDYYTDPSDDRIEYALPYDIGALRNLVVKKLGQRYPEAPLHPIFQRTADDVARDFLKSI